MAKSFTFKEEKGEKAQWTDERVKEFLLIILLGILAALLAAIIAKYYENLLKRKNERNLLKKDKKSES